MWLAQGCFPHNLKISLQRWHALIFGHLTKSFFGSIEKPSAGMHSVNPTFITTAVSVCRF